MRWSDLQAAFLAFFREQAARLQGRAGTARRVFSCLERSPRAVTFSPFIAATPNLPCSLSRASCSLKTHQHLRESKKSHGYKAPGGSPGSLTNNLESTLCWLRGGASPGVNFQLVHALFFIGSPFSPENDWLMIIPHVLPRGFFPPSSGEHPKGCRKLLFGMQGEGSYHIHAGNLDGCISEYR